MKKLILVAALAIFSSALTTYLVLDNWKQDVVDAAKAGVKDAITERLDEYEEEIKSLITNPLKLFN